MTRPIKHFEKGLTYVAKGAFAAVRSVNQYKPNPSFTPKWADKPILKSWQKSKPTLGFPRQTDSLCPNCVIEAREAIINGDREVSTLINEKVGEIKAQIIERDGEVWMIKDCPTHGHFEDLMAMDSKFLQHIESLRSDNVREKLQLSPAALNGASEKEKESYTNASTPVNGSNDTVGLHNTFTTYAPK